jgi:hypothetical protein
MCNSLGMGDLDRRKHDVDVIERVLGGVRDHLGAPAPSHVVAVCDDIEDGHSTVELTVAIVDDAPPRSESQTKR